MSTTPTQCGQVDSVSSTELRPQRNSDRGCQEVTSDEQSYSTFDAFDEHVLHELDKLFGGIEDTNERLWLISISIQHLQKMEADILQPE